MPNHCILPGCTISRQRGEARRMGVYIVQINPYPRFNKEWHANLLEFCYKYKDKKRVWEIAKKGNAGICEYHFAEDDFQIVSGKRRVVPGTMPTLNLPRICFEEAIREPQQDIAEHETAAILTCTKRDALAKAFSGIERPEWTLIQSNDTFRFVCAAIRTRRLCIDVEEDLTIRCSVDGHVITWRGPSLDIESSNIRNILNYAECIPLEREVSNRPLVNAPDHHEFREMKIKDQSKHVCTNPAHRNCSIERLQETVESLNEKYIGVDSELKEIKSRLTNCFMVELPFVISKDIQTKMTVALETSYLTPYQKLFWEVQAHLLNNMKGGERYHPELIRLALSLYMTSPTAYNYLNGVLTLPSKIMLLNLRYKYPEKQQHGFFSTMQSKVLRLIQDITVEEHKYVFLAFVEMRIRNGLVFDKISGKLVGFVNHSSAGTTDTKPEGRMLGVYLKGISGSFSMLLTYFPIGRFLANIFLGSLMLLEGSGLKVMAVCCDVTDYSKKFFSNLTYGSEFDHKFVNPFDKTRYVFLWPDPPQLLKTARNSMIGNTLISPDGPVKWSHIEEVYFKMSEQQMYQPTKSSSAPVHLSSYSMMSDRFAAQILSASVARVLQMLGHRGTAKFAQMFDKFFSICNASSGGKSEANSAQSAFSSIDDPRLVWLEAEFLAYLTDWYAIAPQGQFIALRTYEGLKLLVHSIRDLTKYLLTKTQMTSVCLGQISQNCIEKYFGYQKGIGRVNDNPSDLEHSTKHADPQQSIANVQDNAHNRKRSLSYSSSDETSSKQKRTEAVCLSVSMPA